MQRLNSRSDLTMSLSPDSIPEGYLPPFEVTKAYALHLAMEAVERELGKPAYALPGKRVHRRH